jgi:cyclophilin family peptidyl-prolyl cis-trans isomerase
MRILRVVSVLAVALWAFAATGCGKSGDAPAPKKPSAYGIIETDFGTIEFELLAKDAPKSVSNFRLLAQRGYYNGVTFHRLVKDFMIQGGDPLGTGFGGESAWGGKFEDEIDRTSPLYRDGYKRGTVAMANSGPNTNTSQFFIVQKDYPLPPGYTIFGKVTKGMDVVDKIVDVPCVRGIDGNLSKPVKPVVMKKVWIRIGENGGPAAAEEKKS